MTAHLFTELKCDAPGCRQYFPNTRPVIAGSPQSARKYAAEAGWSYSNLRGDFCPAHTKDG